MKQPLLILTFLLFAVACEDGQENPSSTLTDFQEESIAYFNEIALGVEFGNFREITRKWKTPMTIYVGGDISENNRTEIEKVVAEINTLVSDGFEIQFAADSAECNFYVYLGNAAEYSTYFPEISQQVTTARGYSYLFFNQRAELTGGHLFVDTDRTDPTEQKHLIREELTQSVGLARHSDRYPTSIFMEEGTTVTEFSALDKEIIRLLYHPNMVVGLDALGCEAIIANIYSEENSD